MEYLLEVYLKVKMEAARGLIRSARDSQSKEIYRKLLGAYEQELGEMWFSVSGGTMVQEQPGGASGPLHVYADAALAGITALIKQAIQSSDDNRVAELDQVLRNLEKLIEVAGMQNAPGSSAVHEQQTPYTV